MENKTAERLCINITKLHYTAFRELIQAKKNRRQRRKRNREPS